MNTAKKLVVAGMALAFGMAPAANASKQKEEDSAYQWGRWAVLSPAAGGEEPYIAAMEPGASNNTRPETADEFDKKVRRPTNPPSTPVVAAFCNAGADCGYATYSKGNTDSRFQAESAVDGYDQSANNPDGPVLARFKLNAAPVQQTGFDAASVEAAALNGQPAGTPQAVTYQVSGTRDVNFPDIDSVPMEGVTSYAGTRQSVARDRTANGDPRDVRTTQVSTLTEQFDFNGVDTGTWSDDKQVKTGITPVGGRRTTTFDFFSAGGHFAFGATPTIEQMERFAAGNVTAVYQGVVLDYGSGVTLAFDLGAKTVVGRFASENGFNGFEASGAVDGVNFSAEDGANGFIGSFFSGGKNVSGAVKNATQLGIYSADHVQPR